MEFKELFIALAIIVVGLIAFFGFSIDNQTVYGGESLTSTINNTEQRIIKINNTLAEISGSVGDAGETQEGASEGTGETGLISRARGILGAIPELVGLPLDLLNDLGKIFPINETLIQIARYVIIFTFFITLAYLFILGTTRLRT